MSVADPHDASRSEVFASLQRLVAGVPGAVATVVPCERERGCEVFSMSPEEGAGASVRIHLFDDTSGVVEVGGHAGWSLSGFTQAPEMPVAEQIEDVILTVAAGGFTETAWYSGKKLIKVVGEFSHPDREPWRCTDYTTLVPIFLRRGKRSEVTRYPPYVADVVASRS